MNHNTLPAVFEVGERRPGEPYPLCDVALGEAKLSASLGNSPSKPSIEFHIRHHHKLPGSPVGVKLTLK